jgi:hypothetical protein
LLIGLPVHWELFLYGILYSLRPYSSGVNLVPC